MRCPNCGNRVPDADVGSLSACPACKRSLPAPADNDLDSPPEAEAVSEEEQAHAVISSSDFAQGGSVGADIVGAAKEASKPAGGAVRPNPRAKKRLTRRFDGGGPGDEPTTETPAVEVPPDQAKTPARTKIEPEAAPARPPSLVKDDALPSKLGPFIVRGKLGEGGMGMVLNAYDPQLDRKIAIKVLSNKLAQDAEFVQRFLAEARAIARVSHPNVAAVYFADSEGEQHFFAMEFIEGESLDTKIERNGPMTPKEAIGFIMQTVRGLSAAAERGIVHRDIKPANIMVAREGEVKVMDFGLAKLSGQDLKLTQVGTVLGSPHFMAPEQGRGEDTDLRTDIYSLGATFYYLVAGHPPYSGDTALAVILKHQEASVPQLERAPPSLNRLLGKMMGKKQEDRYPSYSELMKDLVRLDKSGLLRDEIIQSDESSGHGGGPTPRPLPSDQALTSPGPPTPPRPTSTANTQRTDDAAALMNKLDVLMKDSAPAKKNEVPSPPQAPGLGRRMTSAVTKMLNQERTPGAQASGLDSDEDGSKIPVAAVLAAVGTVVILLILIVLRPWSSGSAGTDSALAGEDPKILEALENLKPLLNDESPATRRHALATIRRNCKSASGELFAIRALSDEDENVRIEAARTITDFKRNGAAGRIAILLADKSPGVRVETAKLLVDLTGYSPLLRIDWHSAPDNLRKAIADEFMEWLHSQGFDDLSSASSIDTR